MIKPPCAKRTVPAPMTNSLFATSAPAMKTVNRAVLLFASMLMPTVTKTGRISLAIVSDGCIHVSCPFAGMTRIRFKGFFSAPIGHPSERV